jgi:hypothetical protein
MTRIITSIILLLFLNACQSTSQNYEAIFENPLLYSQAEGMLTDVITHDVFSPPVASRIYAYANLAAYEVIASESEQFGSLKGILKQFDSTPLPEQPISRELTSLLAFANVGQALTFSKDSTQKMIDHFLQMAKDRKMPVDLLNNSIAYAKVVSDHVLKWSEKDNYKQTRSAVKYTVNNTDGGRWVPTPPAYMQAIEPSWMDIRAVILDSANQFLPKPPSKFTDKEGSDFYKVAFEVYNTGNNLTAEEKAIADFWDCNAYKLNTTGHMMFATKAMSPGGHWMGITGIVSETKNADFETTVFAYTGVSFAIMDAFIACWNTKFHYNLLRPETYINLYIDNAWEPYLQTPPFPEYTSGHSIVSKASATVLTNIFGENTAFVDSTERRWGWPDREFVSVNAAAHEAAESRIYGGIHYREAVDAGLTEGEKIGTLVFNKLETAKIRPSILGLE